MRTSSAEAPGVEGDLSEEPESRALTRTELTRWKHVRWARRVVVLMALSCFISIPREPWSYTLLTGLLAIAYWVSLRASLPGLLIGFASALPGFAYRLVAAALDWAHVYPSEPGEDELLTPRANISHWQTFFMALFGTLLWRGLAAAARLTGEVKRSWYLLRPALLLSVGVTICSSIALIAASLSGVAALLLELVVIVAVAPLLWRARDEWGTLADPRRLAPWHAFETAGLLIALAAFMRGYLHLADRFGLQALDSVEAYLLDGWPEGAILFLMVGWAPLVEEILFRGFVQSRFERVTTPGTALVAQAMLFSAAHSAPGSLVSHAVVGLALGFSRNHTGTLYAPFALHAGYNAWAVLSALGHLPDPLALP